MGGDTRPIRRQDCRLIIVSIAGGDSWVGIPRVAIVEAEVEGVSIAGGDSWVGIRQRRYR